MLFLLLIVCGLTLYSEHHFIQTSEQEDFHKRYDNVSKALLSRFWWIQGSNFGWQRVQPQQQQLWMIRFKVYPTQAFEEKYETNNPVLCTVIAASIFVLVILLFVVYDCLVQQQQKQMIQSAHKSTAVVSLLFPKSVHG
jgi:hypothetical protein